MGMKVKKSTTTRYLASLSCILYDCYALMYIPLLIIKAPYETITSVSVSCIRYVEIQLDGPLGGCLYSVQWFFTGLWGGTVGGTDWTVTPLFLCGCVEGSELLTNTPVTYLFLCASTLDLALFYSLSHRTSVLFDPEDILCILSSWSVSALKNQHRTHDLYSFMHFYRDNWRFKHSAKQIKDRLETLSFKLDNDGKYSWKYSFLQPLSIMWQLSTPCRQCGLSEVFRSL